MKTKILFIMHMPPPIHGAAMMGKYIHDSKLINDKFDCHYINLATAKSLRDIGKGGVGKIWKYLCLLTSIAKKLLVVKPQLVYVTPNSHGGAFYKDFVVVELIKFLGYKVVAHYHNKGVSICQNRWLDDKLYHIFFKNIKVILLAKTLYNDVEKYVKREDVFICPNGIPEALNKKIVGERRNFVPQLLFLSNLLEDKGVLVLLDALKILKDNGYSFICHFVGGETAEIDAVRFENEVEKRGLNKMAIYVGKKYGSEKMDFLRNADAFIFPTFYHKECFPLVLLEAMQLQLPCISTNEGGISAIVEEGKTGFLVEKRNSFDLAKKIEYLLNHPDESKRMGENGYFKLVKEFTLETFEERMVEILGECG